MIVWFSFLCLALSLSCSLTCSSLILNYSLPSWSLVLNSHGLSLSLSHTLTCSMSLFLNLQDALPSLIWPDRCVSQIRFRLLLLVRRKKRHQQLLHSLLVRTTHSTLQDCVFSVWRINNIFKQKY